MGLRFQELRERAGKSQAQTAEAAGVPVATLRNWEYGRREPLLSAAGRLAAALGVDVGELLKPPQGRSSARPRGPGRPRKAPPPAEAAREGSARQGPAEEEKPARARRRKGG
jgi:transcriptional regulator with XRE-family HTH domain